ncbi:MAG: FAD-dependent oxidoreductase, partial [Candidatus Schekmanbacteria bacterium]
MNECDILIVGAGITGLSIAKEISEHFDSLKVIIIDKENELAFHASGRNTGVIHAGFYYSADSLKAKFTAEGNRLLTNYCLSNGLSILRCGKVVVAKNEKEIELIDELKRRGDKNGVTLKVIDERELSEIEPNARTFRKALFSPSTSSINPKEILIDIANRIKRKEGFEVNLGVKYLKRIGKRRVRTSSGEISFKYLVNCAGLYADKIAHQYGVGRQYLLLPFKGLY